MQTSLNIYEEWCTFHNIDTDLFGKRTFEVSHKIRAKINGLHITGVSNSGKYILHSIRNGLMNCGRMRCQASDNFTFGSCIDKTLIYTDEMWFTPQNVEGKCIPEGTEMFINIKHQNERLLKRTPSLSTSNDNPWRHVMGKAQALQNRMFVFETKRPMKKLLEWGAIKLNPVMWLTIWRYHNDKYINNKNDNTLQRRICRRIRASTVILRRIAICPKRKQSASKSKNIRICWEKNK